MDVRDQILTEATRLFAARGFDATPLQDVADAVGIRKPSLLYHFPSKAALRQGVLEKMAVHWSEVLPRLLKAATSGEGRFDAVVTAMVKFFTEDPDRARLVIREFLDRPDEIRILIDTHARTWVEIVCNYIRKGQEEGRVYADVDPEAYVVQVINMIISGIATYDCISSVLAHKREAKKLFDRHIREMLRMARRGLFVPSAEEHESSQPKARRGR